MQIKQLLDIEKIRSDFQILKQKVNNKPLIYLDSSATSLTPDCVINEIEKYYKEYRANVHRGIHALSEKATLAGAGSQAARPTEEKLRSG